MRAKDLWEVFPLPEKMRDMSTRVKTNRWTKSFCLLAVLHCVLQIGLQLGAFANNHATAASFEAVVSDLVLTPKPFAILENNGDVTLCTKIPQRFGGPDPCERLSFNGSSSPARVAIITPRFTASLELKNGRISPDEIGLQGLEEEQPNEIDVSPECLSTFPWVFDVTHNATREDIVSVLFQCWLLAVSFAAIFKESIPHVATALASETLATVWSAYKVARTESFKVDFARIVTGTCGVNVLPHYFGYREALEATIMVLNILALLGFLFLSWQLYKEYAPRMLKRVDSRPDMERLYRVMLSLSTVIHLAAFFLVTVSGLFIDQLFVGRIRLLAEHVTIYEVIFILLIAFTVPWVIVGLISTRNESRRGMVFFFIISLAFLAVWGTMFASQIYRFMFFTWSFFATASIFACLLLVTVVCLSVYAFLNFGLGLPEYFQRPMTPHPADKVSWMIEAGIDLELSKSRGNMRMETMPGELTPPVSNYQFRRISLPCGSIYPLDTSPSQPAVDAESHSNSAQSRLAKPIATNLTLPTSANNSNGSLYVSPRMPPGLTVPRRKPLPPVMGRLLVPPSRWSATTANSDPSTPAPISATGVHLPNNQSRWSSSTTATNTTSTSGGRLEELPPVPALPRSRVSSSEGVSSHSGSGHRNVI